MEKYTWPGRGRQQGSGLGSVLRGVYRMAVPRIKKSGKNIAEAIGKEVVRAGVNVASNVAARGLPIRESLKSRAKESGRNLKRKLDERVDEFFMLIMLAPQSSAYTGDANISVAKQRKKKRPVIKSKKSCQDRGKRTKIRTTRDISGE